ncbi:MAG: hypothetical protein FWG85_08215 [Bacteroidetes bacterium]|nr:hypothetical protein [Bacteroidota bacterium]
MDSNLIVLISATSLSTIMIIVAMFTLFQNLTKKIDDVKTELTKKIDAINDRITKLEILVEKLNSKFGIVEERNTATNNRVSKLETEVKEFKIENKTELKEQQNTFKEIINKITDIFKSKDVLTEEPQVAV